MSVDLVKRYGARKAKEAELEREYERERERAWRELWSLARRPPPAGVQVTRADGTIEHALLALDGTVRIRAPIQVGDTLMAYRGLYDWDVDMDCMQPLKGDGWIGRVVWWEWPDGRCGYVRVRCRPCEALGGAS
jgi:hypothetical protein